MKVALVNTSLLPGRGSDLVVHQLATALSARHEVTVFAPFGSSWGSAPYKVVSRPAGKGKLRASFATLRLLLRLRSQLSDFDIVNCHHAILSLLLPSRRLITTYHGYRGRLHFAFGKSVANRMSAFIRGRVISHSLRRGRCVTIVSDSLRQEVLDAGISTEPQLIYNGVEVAQPVADPPAPDPYFLYLGRLDPDKSVDNLIDLYLQSGVGQTLIIAGDGADRVRLECQYARDVRIRFVGRKSREEVPALLAGSIAFLTASTYETFCIPVIEAALVGRPSVGPRSGSLPEVIRDGETGYLYDNADEFRTALTALAGASQPERERMARSCREWAGRFGWASRCEAYERVFESVEAAHGPMRTSNLSPPGS